MDVINDKFVVTGHRTACSKGDITGVVFEVDGSQAVQRLLLSDGNGRSAKPFKSEWATVKDTRPDLGEPIRYGIFLHASEGPSRQRS